MPVELPDTRLVSVGDRESDLLALLIKACDLGHGAALPAALPAQPGAARGR